MAVKSIREQVEALPDDERITLKLRAKAIKDEILSRTPEMCRQPFDDLLNEVCEVSAFDDYQWGNAHDGRTMALVRDIFDGMGDREDGKAIVATDDVSMVRHRNLEAGFRSISRTLDAMISDDVRLKPEISSTLVI